MQIRYESERIGGAREGGMLTWRPPNSLISEMRMRGLTQEQIQEDLTLYFSSTIERFLRLFCLLNNTTNVKEFGAADKELNDAMKRIAKKYFSETI